MRIPFLNPYVWLRPRTKISRRETGQLKDRIRQRLKTEDYTCRLPKVTPDKPRKRYKLRTVQQWWTSPPRTVWK